MFREALYQIILFEMAIVAGSAFGTAELMKFLDKGEHPWFGGLIGGGAGFLTVWLFWWSNPVTGGIVAIIFAIIGNFLLTKLSVPTISDVLNDAVDGAENREIAYITHGNDKDKRAKYLRVYTNRHHGITTSIPAQQAYNAIAAAIDGCAFFREYADAKLESHETEQQGRVYQFTFSHAFIRLVAQEKDSGSRVTVWVNEEATNQMKWLESLKYVKRIERAWDAVYILAKETLVALDANIALDFTLNGR